MRVDAQEFIYLRVVLLLHTKLILKPELFQNIFPYVKKSPISQSDVKLAVKSTGNSIFRVKVEH